MPPQLVHHLDLFLPHLPPALEGLRIAHLSDLHIGGPRRRHAQTLEELAALEVDLIFLTGDYISHKGQEAASSEAMAKIAAGLRARLGVFGVFGNHDTPELRRLLAGLPLRWLHNECIHLAGLPLEILGVDTDFRMKPDSVALVKGWAKAREALSPGHAATGGNGRKPANGAGHERPLRILLSHLPMFLASAGDMAIDVMFAGHTHGGQCRLPRGRALINSSDLPLHLTSGLLRHQETICVVSRGLGEMTLPIRFLCPPHVPLVTLRRGALLGEPTGHIHNVRPW